MPVFISLTNGYSEKTIQNTVKKTSIYVILICIISFLFGEFILEFFGITIHALKIAGGIIISRSGFQLLNAKHKKDIKKPMKEELLSKEDISFSPLAMPLLSGPGSMSLLINLAITYQGYHEKISILASILCVGIIIYLIFVAAPSILKNLGNAGLRSLSKIMGFIVLSIGIQMLISTLQTLFFH